MRNLASTGVNVQWNFHPNWVGIVIMLVLIVGAVMFYRRRHSE